MTKYTRYIIGPQGKTGFQGLQGVQGKPGQISIGSVGLQSFSGPAGNDGNQGLIGLGPQGLQGTQGDLGPASDIIGSQGIQGYQGNGVQGLQGTQGRQGDVNPSPVIGSQGSQGTQGSIGTQGYISTSGVQGAQGSQGPQGVQGGQGIQHSEPFTGAQGVQQSGAQGSQGNQGINTGASGYQGRQGIQGTQQSGAQGGYGRQGPQGTIDPEIYEETYDDFTGTGVESWWIASQQTGSGGSFSITDSGSNGVVLLSQSVSGEYVAVAAPSVTIPSIEFGDVYIAARMRGRLISSSAITIFGLMDAYSGTFIGTPRFLYKTDQSISDNWIIDVEDVLGFNTQYDTGQPVESGIYQTFAIQYTSDDSFLRFYIDGILVFTTEVSVYTGGAPTIPIFGAKETSGDGALLYIDYFYVRTNKT